MKEPTRLEALKTLVQDLECDGRNNPVLVGLDTLKALITCAEGQSDSTKSLEGCLCRYCEAAKFLNS